MNHNHTQHTAPVNIGAFLCLEETVSAKVITPPNPYRFQAWCETCQDGLNSHSSMAAHEWAHDHNANKHSKGTK